LELRLSDIEKNIAKMLSIPEHLDIIKMPTIVVRPPGLKTKLIQWRIMIYIKSIEVYSIRICA